MEDKEIIRWFEQRVGKLMGCYIHERDESYKKAIQAIKNEQSMQEQRKESNPLTQKLKKDKE